MRDLFVTLAVFATLPLILWRPWLGVLAWSWLGYMNPHRLTWGFAYDLPFAMMIALTTLVALLASKEPKRIPWTRETILLLVLIAWMFMTTVFALWQAPAWEQWAKVLRIMLMTYVTMMLITDEHRIKMLMFVIALSLGFYGFKGGIFTLTGGSVHSVMGPAKSFIGDRNSIGLALIMTVPLLHYLQMQMTRWYARYALLAGIGLTLVAIVGTHSRGALVGIVAIPPFGPLDQLVNSYGLAIVCFLSGIHWANYLANKDELPFNLMVSSNAIFLLAWFGYVVGELSTSLAIQIASLAVLLLIDWRLKADAVLTAHYFRVRFTASSLAIASLIVVLLS